MFDIKINFYYFKINLIFMILNVGFYIFLLLLVARINAVVRLLCRITYSLTISRQKKNKYNVVEKNITHIKKGE